MDEEILVLKVNQTQDLDPAPSYAFTINKEWIYTIKLKHDGYN